MARKFSAPSLLTTGLVTQHTISAGVDSTLISAQMVNLHTSAINVRMELIGSGQTAGDRWAIMQTQTGTNDLSPGETRVFTHTLFRDAGTYLQASASTGAKIAFSSSILEEAPAGRKFSAPVLLTTGLVTQHTISAGTDSTIISCHAVNLHSSAVNVRVELIAPSTSAADRFAIVATQTGTNELSPGETRNYTLPIFRSAGYFLQASASTGGVVAFSASILEEDV